MVAEGDSFVMLAVPLALLRVFFALAGVNLCHLPISRFLARRFGKEFPARFHRWGFVFSIGYLLFFLPEFLVNL